MRVKDLKQKTPWWTKIAFKWLSWRLGFRYRFRKSMSLSSHGNMEQPSYAFRVFNHHFHHASPPPGFVMMELGPGDSLFSPLIGKAMGAGGCYLVDVGDFASRELKYYERMIDFLNQQGCSMPQIRSTDQILDYCNARYLTSGLASLQEIPDDSIDFIWSQAVFEHIRKRQFLPILQELHRISRKTAVSSHVIDLRDHIANALNHLRFSEKLWESEFMFTPGCYTNRIGYRPMLDLFQEAGFETQIVKLNRWKRLPTPRAKLSREFRGIPDEDLCISGFSVILRPVKDRVSTQQTMISSR
jgi:hypothetical protein